MEKSHTAVLSKSQSKFYTWYQSRPKAPRWERPALLILLLLTAAAYIWGLGQSGWANSFYSAAVQAGTKSWKAFFFGSIDAANFITVDKPPASIWVMELSARIFGLNSWSMLIPEALEGVACVWVLYLAVRRWFSAGAALLAGAILAITPVAALMFRFNNPDALLVLLLTASSYAFTRALEEGKTKWLLWASVLIGLGFLAKMLAAFLIIPVFVLVYLLFAPVTVRRREVQMVVSAMTVLVSAGWWVAIVQLTPAANRPYIGSSQNNSLLNLIFGYNGLGRLTGNESGMGGQGGGGNIGIGRFSGSMGGSGGFTGGFGGTMGSYAANMGGPGGGMGGNFSGSTGLTRLFNSEMGGQISWLIPAALILLVVAVWLVRRNWKSDRTVPALLLWGGTFLVTGIVFSFSQGTIHSYYTIALAPSIGAIIGISAEVLWNRRDQLAARSGLATAIALTAIWSFALLDRTPTWNPWMRAAILIIGGAAAIAIVIGPRLGRRLTITAAAVGMAACLAGPFAYTLQTIATPHTGSTPSAGPTTNGGGFSGRFGPPSMNSTNSPTGGSGNSGFGSFSGNRSGNFNQGAPSGGFGGGSDATPGKEMVKLLQQSASKFTWAAATVGSQSSAPYQLATSEPIMDIGGFTGSDPTPTLSQFEKYVSEGKIHYFISGGMNSGRMSGNFSNGTAANSSTNGAGNGGPFGGNFQNSPMGGQSNSAITTWVQNHFKSTTVDGVTVYDLTKAK